MFYERSTPVWKMSANIFWSHMMQYTGLISVVKTSIPGWHHLGLKITQILAFLDFFKTVSDGNWNIKVHKSQCLMNDQLAPVWKISTNVYWGHRMNYIGLISMVLKPGSQAAAILNSKLHKHWYF